MSSDEDEKYARRRKPDHIYVSKAFPEDGLRKRFLHLAISPETHEDFATVKKQVVIRESLGDREQISAIVYQDTREIASLILQRFGKESGKPYKASFNLRGEEIDKLLQLVEFAKTAPFAGRQRIGLDEESLDALSFSEDTLRSFVLQNRETIAEIIKESVTTHEIRTLARRRRELEQFQRLLTDDVYFKDEAKKANESEERVWQKFFEQTRWIFGYGLIYTSLEAFQGKTLEQTVAGHSISGRGKRVDALLKTRGEISAICFVEIKTHKTHLLEKYPYRPEAWAVSKDLAGAVAQCQRTVQSALLEIGTRHDEIDEIGDPTGGSAYLYRPRSLVVAGQLGEFVTSNGINESKFSSFELFRRQLQSPEVITFDELLERAKFIVHVEECRT